MNELPGIVFVAKAKQNIAGVMQTLAWKRISIKCTVYENSGSRVLANAIYPM